MEVTVSISFSRCSRDDRSHTDPVTLNPLFFHSCKRASSSIWLREHVWTIAPNLANSSTVACLITINEFPANKFRSKYAWEKKKSNKQKEKESKTYPMPRVPPVTKAVIPLRDHLLFLLMSSCSPMLVFKFCWKPLQVFVTSFWGLQKPPYQKHRNISCSFHNHAEVWTNARLPMRQWLGTALW